MQTAVHTRLNANAKEKSWLGLRCVNKTLFKICWGRSQKRRGRNDGTATERVLKFCIVLFLVVHWFDTASNSVRLDFENVTLLVRLLLLLLLIVFSCAFNMCYFLGLVNHETILNRLATLENQIAVRACATCHFNYGYTKANGINIGHIWRDDLIIVIHQIRHK